MVTFANETKHMISSAWHPALYSIFRYSLVFSCCSFMPPDYSQKRTLYWFTAHFLISLLAYVVPLPSTPSLFPAKEVFCYFSRLWSTPRAYPHCSSAFIMPYFLLQLCITTSWGIFLDDQRFSPSLTHPSLVWVEDSLHLGGFKMLFRSR